VHWNEKKKYERIELHHTYCTAGDKNPFQGAISFDNIGLAWVAIFQVSMTYDTVFFNKDVEIKFSGHDYQTTTQPQTLYHKKDHNIWCWKSRTWYWQEHYSQLFLFRPFGFIEDFFPENVARNWTWLILTTLCLSIW
jgi:hypothetical protein